MRLFNEKANLDPEKVKDFFNRRAEKYDRENPYITTMYQDKHKELADERNRLETEKIGHFIALTGKEKILDLGCGIGRWSDALGGRFESYLGIDASEELINIAVQRHSGNDKIHFRRGDLSELSKSIEPEKKFDRILLVGVLMYCNDSVLGDMFSRIAEYAGEKAKIIVREPIALGERLTLKDFYSDELGSDYNAIYRTYDEIMAYMEPHLLDSFFIEDEGFLFSEKMNNRAETAQYYFILSR